MNIIELNKALSKIEATATCENNSLIIAHKAFTVTIKDNVENFELSSDLSEIAKTLPKVLRILNEHINSECNPTNQ